MSAMQLAWARGGKHNSEGKVEMTLQLTKNRRGQTSRTGGPYIGIRSVQMFAIPVERSTILRTLDYHGKQWVTMISESTGGYPYRDFYPSPPYAFALSDYQPL